MLRVGVDIGGTFTDITVLDEATGQILSDKILTTPSDPSVGVLDGLRQMSIDLKEVSFLVHGTTVAINALIEQKGSRTGLITTAGFEDILEIGRGNRTVFFDIFYQRPAPLVPRRWRLGVTERINAAGDVVQPLDTEQTLASVERLVAEGVQSVAVCFFHAFRNPAHERQVRDLVQARYPNLDVSLSSDVLPEIREYERLSTTVTNGYLKPVIRAYIENLQGSIKAMGGAGQLHVMQSNGGIMTAELAKERPVQIVESGPVGGAVAAAYVVGAMADSPMRENVIAFDMGGTTSKSCVVHRGVMQTTTEYWPAGYMVKIPVVDIVEVGIGGGSIGWINPEGFLAVGPWSAGAEPGPVCYGLGGAEPTITDANAVLGRVEQLVGGRMRLDARLAECAIQDKLCNALQMTPVQAAMGILEIAVAKMADTIRTVTVSRGIDPRDFTLCAFGGAGPMHAAFIAREMDIPLAVIPPAPGTFSGLGFLCSDFRHDFVQTSLMDAARPDLTRIQEVFSALEARGAGILAQEGFASKDVSLRRSLDIRYVGQAHEVNVPVAGSLNDSAITDVLSDFHGRHEEHYGHSAPAEPVEIVNLRVTALGRVNRPSISYRPGSGSHAEKGRRRVYFKEADGWLDCPIFERSELAPGFKLNGPAIIEEHTSNLVLPPDFRAEVDNSGNIILQR